MLSTGPLALAQSTDAATLLQLAQQQEAAGKLSAAAAFHAAGNPTQEAAAYVKSAAANEQYADQLLGVAAPEPTAGQMVGGKPVGLFFATRTILDNFRTLSYYFSPAGMAYEEPLGLSAAELAATPARSQGRYTAQGKTLSIAWTGYPKPETADLHTRNGYFSWSGGALFSKDITFRADGTYTGGGVVSFTSVTETSVAESGSSSQQAGRWRLDGWHLTLTDAQGHTIRDVAYPVNTGDKQVSLFNFNGTAYSRR